MEGLILSDLPRVFPAKFAVHQNYVRRPLPLAVHVKWPDSERTEQLGQRTET